MNNKLVIYITVFLLLSVPIQGYVNLKVISSRCHDNGVFSLVAQNRYDDSLDLSTVNMTLFHPKMGYFTPKGSWDKDAIFLESTHSQIAEFTSLPGNTNLSGYYTGKITYNGCKYEPCEEVFSITACKEFDYACELSKLEITNCFQRGQEFWVKFKGLNSGQYEKLNPFTDLTYYIESSERNQNKLKLFEGMTLLPNADDTYLLKIPTIGLEKVYSFGIAIDRCNRQDNLLKEPVWCRANQQESKKQEIGLFNETEEQGYIEASIPKNYTSVEKPDYTEVPETKEQDNGMKVEKTEKESSFPWLILIVGLVWFIAILIIVFYLVKEYRN